MGRMSSALPFFMLHNDENSRVKMSKPNQNSIALYRGITPSSVGLDVHGGCGETWTRDFSHAKRYARPPYGYVLEATLPSTAKQLVLMTVDDKGYSDYVEDGIRHLAELVGDSWLYDSLMSGRNSLWEVWEPEWTEILIKAGYDSVFTGGFDGPEEYVLNPALLQFTRYFSVLANDQIAAYPIEPGTLEKLGYVVGLRTAV